MAKKISLVVGGSRGIGGVIAQTLKKRGDKVYVLSRKIKDFEKNIKADLTDELVLKRKLLSKFKAKRLNNIIFSQRYRGSEWLEDFKVSLFSIESIIDLMKSKMKKNSSVVIISSVANRTILDDQTSSYHLTRGALEQLVKYYAVKLGKYKIRFNCLLPTKIIKPENEKFFYKNKKGKSIKKLVEEITPLKTMGTAKDVANAVEFFTDDKSKFINGQSIVIDGGASLLSQESVANILKNKKNLLKNK